jgi:hypothetical protein
MRVPPKSNTLLIETIDDAMERCEYKVTTHDNRLPKIVTNGTLKFLNNVMVYEFAWVNSNLLSEYYSSSFGHNPRVLTLLQAPTSLS